MTEEKKKVGRPRKYESRAARQKAYLERKKQKMKDLEEQVKQLEKQTAFSTEDVFSTESEMEFKEIKKAPWHKITPSEIAIMGTKDLEELIKDFRKRMQQYKPIRDSIENIMLGILHKNKINEDEPSNQIQEIIKQIDEQIGNLDERMQQQALLYLLEAELANRLRLEGRKTKIELFEDSIKDLEKGLEKKEIKKEIH